MVVSKLHVHDTRRDAIVCARDASIEVHDVVGKKAKHGVGGRNFGSGWKRMP